MPAVENSEVRIHYELSGNDRGEVLVLGNSIGSNLGLWNKVLPALEKEYVVLRYDMRGHGMSSTPPRPYSLDQLGGDVLFLLDSLGMNRVSFCGLSLGGIVAMWLGIHAPERVRRLVLANTAASIGTPKMWDERIATVQSTDMGTLAKAVLTRWFTPSYCEAHPDEMKIARDMIAFTDRNGYLACCDVLRDTDLRNELGAISAPCLVIAGKYDPATPPSDGQALCRSLRNSKYVELEASHISAWERADEFAREVLAFLVPQDWATG